MAYKQIPNPLLKYQFRDVEMHKKYFVNGRPADANIFFNTPQGEAQPKGSEATDQIWSAWLNTMRCPDENGVTQHDVVDTQMYKQNRKSVSYLFSNILVRFSAGGNRDAYPADFHIACVI